MAETTESGSTSTKTEEGVHIKGKDVIFLDTPKIRFPENASLNYTDKRELYDILNELFQSDSGGGDNPLIEPWKRPSDWPELPTPKDNQVIFLVTTAYNSSPYCSFRINLLDKNVFPDEYSTFPSDFTASVDWGNGYKSSAIVNPYSATSTNLLWTNGYGLLGAGVFENTDTSENTGDYPCSYYYDVTNKEATDKYWIAEGTVLNDGSRVFVVTVTISNPEIVTVEYPSNCYALEMYIGKNINIQYPAGTGTVSYFLQHVKAFGWQPKDNKYLYRQGIGSTIRYSYGLFSNTRALRKIDATEPFTEITDRMFQDANWLPEMDLSEVLVVGENAFQNCKGYYCGLKTRMFNLLKCKEIKKGAFSNLYNLKFKIIVPELEMLGENAFQYCYGLDEMDIPKVTVIPKQCFYNSTLMKVNAEALYTIEESGFSYCQNLVIINAPNLKHIGQQGFYYCQNLREGKFPLLEDVGNNAFNSCFALEKLVYGEEVNLNNAGLGSSVLWYDNPQLINNRPINIH